MTEQDRLEVFKAQTKNVQKLDIVRTQLTRSINRGLRENDKSNVDVLTKCLALVYCAWVEVNFSKMIHTPHGFTLDEIRQIKFENRKARSVESAWKKAIQLGLRKIEGAKKSNYIPNRKKDLIKLVDKYVVEPSIIRNKIAHGQWEIALNRSNTAVNQKITNDINCLTIVSIDRLFETQSFLTRIVEDFIESPERTFYRDYWEHYDALMQYLENTKTWTLESRIAILKRKPIKR